jgi:RNA polymerase sigma-70 factor, ECF subfamily
LESGTDGELMTRVARGDAAAFEVLVRRYEAPVHRFLVRLMGSVPDAEDARQQAFLRVLTRAAGFRGGSVKSWIFRIAYTVGLNSRRDGGRFPRTQSDPGAHLVDHRPSPACAVESADDRAWVHTAMGRLAPADRTLLWLRVAEDLTFVEISDVLAVPASTLRHRFLRALCEMRAFLREPLDLA